MKITDFGVAIVDSDSHLSKWVLEQRRLDVSDEYCLLFQKYIPIGGTVIDVGACLGDHTLSYARMVEENGTVIAFEPNAEAFECLKHNMRGLKQVMSLEIALGSESKIVSCSKSIKEPDNLGACSVVENIDGNTAMSKLDYLPLFRLNFLKIDAEGWEPDIIEGAKATLLRFKPVILVEINRPILAARGKSPEDIFKPLREMGYHITPSEPHHSFDMDQIDALCIPA